LPWNAANWRLPRYKIQRIPSDLVDWQPYAALLR
jgi:hypothetical protein